MLAWITQHAAALQVATGLLTAVIWIFYLNVFLSTLRRQRRTEILINMGGGSGRATRCFVSNLGLEPVYVLDILVTLRTAGAEVTAAITERDELMREDAATSDAATTQGPLNSGAFADIGSFGDLVARVAARVQHDVDVHEVNSLDLTVVASTASEALIVAARRRYVVSEAGDPHPTTLQAEQIRSRRDRLKIRRTLSEELASPSAAQSASTRGAM